MWGIFQRGSLIATALLLAVGSQISFADDPQPVARKVIQRQVIIKDGPAVQVIEDAVEVVEEDIDVQVIGGDEVVPEARPGAVPGQLPDGRSVPTQPRATTPASASGEAAKKDEVDPESLEGLKKRHQQVQAELTRLKKQPAPKPADEKKILVVLENPHLSQGRYRSNNEYDRAFVVRLLFANPTDQDVELKRTEVVLKSDNKTYKVPASLNNYHNSFNVGGKYYSISSLKMPDVVKIPAGKTESAWAVFGGIPMNPPVPEMTLTLPLGKETQEINVNDFCQGLLQASTERIGPKDCLAIITINGKLNPVNAKSLVDELDVLAGKKVARVIIRWSEQAASVETNLMSWLEQAANQAGQLRPTNRGNNNNPYPIVPMAIRELHLAERPKDNGGSSSSQPRIHKTLDEAIIAALRTAYLALSANEIVDDLRHKNPTIRAAALMGGGGQLPPDKLPILLEFVNSSDRNLQRAAIFAMRNFGEANAIDTLIELVQKNEQPKSTEAAESLATSRFAAASEALLELLKTANPEVKTTIVQVLAKYPRPIWADAIAEYARQPETPIGMAALRALNGIGHPELHALLKNALERKEQNIQMEAFNMLASRKDEASEELALEYTLKHLRTSPPVGHMTNLIARTKDPRAIPLLMRHFQSQKGDRSTLITALSQVGDQSVVDVLVAEYPKLKDQEKRYVLQGLQQLHSPEFVRLAEEALMIKDPSLLNFAADGLYKDGSPKAEKALINALKKDPKHSYWHYICNALVNFGSSEARDALREARDSKDSNKKSAAINALRNLQQRSPGNQYIYQANNYVKQENWDLALRYFNLCIEADSEYAAAYAGRGHLYIRQKKHKEAKADFERALKADPENTQAHAGAAIMTILDGKVDEGVEYMEKARKEFEQYDYNKGMMFYNIACVYGRAVEKLQEKPAGDDRDKKLKEFQNKAVENLQSAVKNHFGDWDLMKKDPDLKAVAELPEVQKLLPQPNQPNRKRPDL